MPMLRNWRIIEGDCLDVLRAMPAGCVDAVVTDPPYGLEFMGKEWDRLAGDWRTDKGRGEHARNSGRLSGKRGFDGHPPSPRYHAGPAAQQWHQQWAAAALHALRPAGYMLAFGGTRTYHRLACAVEDAGFEIRDCILWLYGTGFPKGKGCLKPAYEPVLLCRKPGPKVAPLGIDECRVEHDANGNGIWGNSQNPEKHKAELGFRGGIAGKVSSKHPAGRWPANVVHDGSEEVLGAFAEFGERGGGFGVRGRHDHGRVFGNGCGLDRATIGQTVGHGDAGTAARFFYTAKASRSERGDGNTHPTVKPLALMRWLVRLVCPPGGLVLDPFLGSGTTALAALAEGRRCVGVEREPFYVAIARKRLEDADHKRNGTTREPSLFS